MFYRPFPWALCNIYECVEGRLSSAQQSKFEERLRVLHQRLTRMASPEGIVLESFGSWQSGTNAFDAVACWFLLLLLHDRDWGVRQRTQAPAEIAAIDKATALLRRWLEGDATESAEWRQLLPDPEHSEARGTMSPAGYVAAGMGRVFLNENLTEVLDEASNSYLKARFPARLAKLFPTSLGDKILYTSLWICLGWLAFLVRYWRGNLNRPKVPVNRTYFQVLAQALVRLTQLRWNPQDPEEAELFPLVVAGTQPELLAKYITCLRRQHVEPDEVAETQDILTRIGDVARQIGLQCADPRYVTGMASRRLYSLDEAPPPVLAASRDLQFHHGAGWYFQRIQVTGKRFCSSLHGTTETTPKEAWKKLEDAYDNTICMIEPQTILSNRVFYRTQPQMEYWVIEMNWGSIHEHDDETGKDRTVYRVQVRWGPWPVDEDLWAPPESQNRRWIEFPTRSAALAWYRHEVDRQLAAGYVECLPRLNYFSMKVHPIPVIEGKVVFDTEALLGTVDEAWIQKLPQTAFLPVVERRDGPPDAAKLGGTILAPPGASWPVCKACKRPMSLILQLNLDQLPQELQKRFGSGLLQLFQCNNEETCKGERGPFTETQLGRVLDLQHQYEPLEPPVGVAAASRLLTGWQSTVDYPSRDTYYDHGYGELNVPYFSGDDTQLSLTRKFPCIATDKLGGYPSFWPCSCPKCSANMQLVFQLNSSGLVPFTVWEDTIGMVMQCPEHRNMIALTTQTR